MAGLWNAMLPKYHSIDYEARAHSMLDIVKARSELYCQ